MGIISGYQFIEKWQVSHYILFVESLRSPDLIIFGKWDGKAECKINYQLINFLGC